MDLKMVKDLLKDHSVEGLQRELDGLNAQGPDLISKIERLVARKYELDDVGDLQKAMAAEQAARNQLRKLDIRIAETQALLEQARASVRERRRVELLAEHAKLAPDYLKKARAAQEAFSRVVAARNALEAEGFPDYRLLPIAPGINGFGFLAEDLLSQFENGLNSQTRASAAKAPPTMSEARPSTPKRTPFVSTDPRTAMAGVPLHPPKRPSRRDATAEGEALFTVLRGGLELDGAKLATGDVIALTDAKAEPLLLAGAVDPAPAEAISAGVSDGSLAKLDMGA